MINIPDSISSLRCSFIVLLFLASSRSTHSIDKDCVGLGAKLKGAGAMATEVNGHERGKELGIEEAIPG